MKKYLFIYIVFIVAALSSCKKSTSNTAATQAAADDAAIQTYLTSINATAVKDPSGMYYQIVAAGNSSHPTATSTVAISYTGRLLDGTVFESAASANVALPTAIQAWQIGIPHIGNGGNITLYVPSALAYGTAGTGTVPANAVTIYTIGLQGFN